MTSYTRHHVNVLMTKAKISGNYVDSVLAKREAMNLGYDEALMLDTEGYVSEGSGGPNTRGTAKYKGDVVEK